MGKIYGRSQDEPDKHILDDEGMNIRQCVAVPDSVRSDGYRQVSRAMLLYLDPRTSEIVRNWDNPYTGEMVKVMQIANDPLNGGVQLFRQRRWQALCDAAAAPAEQLAVHAGRGAAVLS